MSGGLSGFQTNDKRVLQEQTSIRCFVKAVTTARITLKVEFHNFHKFATIYQDSKNVVAQVPMPGHFGHEFFQFIHCHAAS